MNKTLIQRKLTSAATVVGMICAAFSFALPASAQSATTQEKITLMANALEARDEGNLQEAKNYLEELIKVEPNNRNVQRMLAAVNKDLERQQQGQRTTYGEAAEVQQYEPMQAPVEVEKTVVVEEEDDVIIEGSRSATDVTAVLQETEMEESEARQIAESALADARALIAQDYFDEAKTVLEEANSLIPESTKNREIKEELSEERARVAFLEAQQAIADRDYEEAQQAIRDYEGIYGAKDSKARHLREELGKSRNNPYIVPPQEVSPDYMKVQDLVTELNRRGRAQYLLGDNQGALDSFGRVLAVDPNNVEAKAFQTRINQELTKAGQWDRRQTRSEMLREVSLGWQRPETFQAPRIVGPGEAEVGPLRQKIRNIVIPRVKFSGVPLRRVTETLSELAEQYADNPKPPVNIVVLGNQNPDVSISLTDFTLEQIIEFITQTINFNYEIREGAIVLFPGTTGEGPGAGIQTEFFPISRQAVIRMTGGGDLDTGGVADDNPFAPAGGGGGGGGGLEQEEGEIRSFLQRAGVDFDNTPGARLAYDGAELIVTQTRENLERIRNILRRYDETRQVEIEAKFIEVQQGALEELGFDWNLNNNGNNVFQTYNNSLVQAGGSNVAGPNGPTGSNLRNLSNAFALGTSSSGNGRVISATRNLPIVNSAPSFPGAINLASTALNTANVVSTFGQWDANLVIRAIEQASGSDLMSAPRITVLSGKTAEIVVAQELRYPESYGDIESDVGQGSGSLTGGSSGVTITAGTPQDFVTRRIGVEMEVTPTVENRDTISLRLEPRVTEFEGFVEYGGQSVAISGGTTVVVPSGFFQPIFSVRQIRTEVTIFDGATVVMGGLTREEVKTVNDKVPVLGDIPLLGRLFQSKGESSQKRNLLIFVTANLISPGGSPANQSVGPIQPGDTFQNPILLTPGGPQTRGLTGSEEAQLMESVGITPPEAGNAAQR